MTIVFSMGRGHNGKEPDAASVLDCLASDASTLENASGFEDWAVELGYDSDSRKAERTYRAIQQQTERLRQFLGTAAFDTLLRDVDRL